jgi:hypothetical protein
VLAAVLPFLLLEEDPDDVPSPVEEADWAETSDTQLATVVRVVRSLMARMMKLWPDIYAAELWCTPVCCQYMWIQSCMVSQIYIASNGDRPAMGAVGQQRKGGDFAWPFVLPIKTRETRYQRIVHGMRRMLIHSVQRVYRARQPSGNEL